MNTNKILNLLVLFLMFSFSSYLQANEIPKCKKGSITNSCEKVKGAKRKIFCSKKQFKKESIEKICKTAKKKRMKRKARKSSQTKNKDSV